MVEHDVGASDREQKDSKVIVPERLRVSTEELMAYAPQESWWMNPEMARNGIHDIGHSARTLIWTDILTNSWEEFLRDEAGFGDDQEMQVNRKVTRLGSAVHDLGRRRDVEPILQTHAHLGAEHFQSIWKEIDPTLTQDEVARIVYLIHYHAGETLTAQVTDKLHTVARRMGKDVPPRPTVGVPSPVELGLLKIADGGLEAARVYESKATIPGQIAVAAFGAVSNLLHPVGTPGEYLQLRNRFWLRSGQQLGFKDSDRPGALDMVPLARRLYVESTADQAAYARDPWRTTFATAQRLQIVKP